MARATPKSAWYAAAKGQAHTRIYQRCTTLRKHQRAWRDTAIFYMRLRAGSRDITGDGLYVGDDGRLRYNLCSSTVDTALSIVASQRPIPQGITKGGNWDLMRKVLKMTRCLQTQAIQLGMYQHAAHAFDDACTVGIGVLDFAPDYENGCTTIERCLPLEFIWDRNEATSGNVPRTMTRARLMARDVAIAIWPESKAAIAADPGPTYQDRLDLQLTMPYRSYDECDQVVVYETVHLPSSKKAKDGRRVVSLANATLEDDEWTRVRYRWAFFRWQKRQSGFLGRSLVEEVQPAQRRIHSLIEFTEKCQDLGSVPRVWVNGGAEVRSDEIANVPMQVLRYQGQVAPTMQTFNATPQDLQVEIDRIREQTWSMLGLTQAQLQGEVQPGITSAVGLQKIDDIGSRRHSQNLKQFESDMMVAFRCLADCNDDVAAEVPEFSVEQSVRARWLETSKWKETTIGEGDARIGVFPISSLSTTPSARDDQLTDWVNRGWLTREVYLQLQGMPDLEAYADFETVDRTYAQYQMSLILDRKGDRSGGPVLPIDYQRLDVAADIARKTLLSAMEDGAPPDVCTSLRNFVDYARTRLADAKGAAAQASIQSESPQNAMPMGTNPQQPGAMSAPPGGPQAIAA